MPEPTKTTLRVAKTAHSNFLNGMSICLHFLGPHRLGLHRGILTRRPYFST